MKDRDFDCLRDVDLFADLSAPEFEALDSQLLNRSFAAGETIVDQGQEVHALFVVRRGRVRIFRRAENGRELTIAILGQGTIFGEMSLLGQHLGDNNAETLEATDLCMIDRERVHRLLIADSRIAFRIMTLLSEQVARLETRIAESSFRPLPVRVATTLLAAGESRWNGRMLVRLTHQQIADLLGVTRESVSRTISQFADLGLVSTGRGRVIIPREADLTAHIRLLEAAHL